MSNEEETTLTLLMQSIFIRNDISEIEEILNSGIDVNLISGDYNDTLLHRIRSKDQIKLLVNIGADINSRDDRDMTPLIKAVFLEKSFDVISELLLYGANLNCTDIYGNTALHYVNCYKIINLLVSYGARIDVKNDNGLTPLMKAVMEDKSISVINSILSNGANPNIRLVNEENLTPIHLSKTVNHVAMFMWYNADINAITKSGDTVLFRLIVDYCHAILKNDVVSIEYASELFNVIKSLMKHSILVNRDELFQHLFLTLTCSNIRLDFSGLLNDIIACLESLKNEFDEMRKFRLCRKFSLYNLCFGFYKNYRIPIENKELFSFIYDDNYENRKDISLLFPIYYDIILTTIKVYKNRFHLYKKLSKLIICNVIDNTNINSNENTKVIYLNYDCLQYIADYLSYRELVNLFLASRKLYKPII